MKVLWKPLLLLFTILFDLKILNNIIIETSETKKNVENIKMYNHYQFKFSGKNLSRPIIIPSCNFQYYSFEQVVYCEYYMEKWLSYWKKIKICVSCKAHAHKNNISFEYLNILFQIRCNEYSNEERKKAFFEHYTD